MKKLEQIKEVTMIDQFIAITDLLEKLGYETSELTLMFLLAAILLLLLRFLASIIMPSSICRMN